VALGAALRASTFGTSFCDGDGKIRVFFPKPSATGEAKYTLAGKVTALDPAIDLHGAVAELENRISGEKREEELGPDGQFAFANLALSENFTNNFTLKIVEVSGNVLMEIARDVEQRRDYRLIGGELSKQAVLSRPIKMDVARGNRVHKKTLLERATELPHEAPFRFKTVDESKVIRFPIYDEHILLKEIKVELDTVPEVGTQVDFVIACDEKFFLTVRGEIEGKKFSVFIEPPPRQKEPTKEDWKKLQSEFDEAVQALPEGQQLECTAKRMRLDRALDEGLSANDMPQVKNKAGEYRDLV
jgi:hypothetical protein